MHSGLGSNPTGTDTSENWPWIMQTLDPEGSAEQEELAPRRSLWPHPGGRVQKAGRAPLIREVISALKELQFLCGKWKSKERML